MPTTDSAFARALGRPILRPLFLVIIALVAPLIFAPPASAQEDGQIWLPIVAGAESPLESPWPPHWMFSVSPNTWLTWGFAEDSTGVRYNVWLDDTPPEADTLVGSNVAGNFVELPTLKSGWRYYWRVDALLPDGTTLIGPVWTFRTEVAEDPPAVGTMIPIPAAEYLMGCDYAHNGGYGCRGRESPQHKVYVDAFEIDKYEVTNGEYKDCVAAGACNLPDQFSSRLRDHYYDDPAYDLYPVLYVSWWDANNYCAWADKRLPTEAEWELAARGPYDSRPWPWGEETIDCTRANFSDTRVNDWQFCVGDTTRVGSYPAGATALGVMDMSGNAFEWVLDIYDDEYYQVSPYLNPQGPRESTDPRLRPLFVLRGGSYRPQWFYPRTFNRHWGHHGHEGPGMDWPYYRNNQVGFRCAR